MPKLRVAAVAASVVLALGLPCAGCSGLPEGPVEVAPPDETVRVDPTPGDAAMWADAALPENALGGATWTQREAGVLEPGAEPVIDLAAEPAGTSTVTFACVTTDATTVQYTVTAPTDVAVDGTLACSAVGDTPAPVDLAEVTAGARIEFDADARGLFVYGVRPDAADPSR